MEIFRLWGTVAINREGLQGDLSATEGQVRGWAGRITAMFGTLAVSFLAIFAVRKVKEYLDESLTLFRGFQQGMAEVFTLMPDLDDLVKEEMVERIKDLSAEFGILASDAVPALYQAISAGVPQENVFEFLEIAAQASIGGVTDLKTAVDGLTSVVNAYGVEVLSVEDAADVMFTTVRLGKTTMEELAGSISTIAPVAAQLGIDFGDIGAAIAEMTSQGMATPQAMTYFRQMLVEMAQEGTVVSDAFKEIAGVSFQEFISQGNSLADALALMAQYAGDADTSLLDMFGRVQGGQAALMLTRGEMVTLNEKMSEMESSAGSLGAAYGGMVDTIEQQQRRLAAFWETTKIGIGEQMQEPLEALLDWLEENKDKIATYISETFERLLNFFMWLVDNAEAIGNGLRVIAIGFTALKAVDLTVWLAASVPKLIALAGLLSPTGAIVAGSALVAVGITKVRDALMSFAADSQAGIQAARDMERVFANLPGTADDAATVSRTLEGAITDLGNVFVTMPSFSPMTDATSLMNFQDALYDLKEDVMELDPSEMAAAWKRGAQKIVNEYDALLPGLADRAREFVTLLDISAPKFPAMEPYLQTGGAFPSVIQEGYGPMRDSVREVSAEMEKSSWNISKALGGIGNAMGKVVTEVKDGVESSRVEFSDFGKFVVTSLGSVFNTLANQIGANKDARRAHRDAIKSIEEEEVEAIKALEGVRDSELESLQSRLDAELISMEEFNDERIRILEEYDEKVEDTKEKTIDALEAQNKAHKESGDSILEVVGNTLKGIMRALREELLLKSAVALAEGLAALLVPGAQVFAAAKLKQAGVLGAAGATLAIAGFEEGGVFDRPTLLPPSLIAEGGVPEAIIPLSPEVLGQIGRGIADASGTSVSMGGMFDGATINVRSDADIKKLAREIFSLQESRLRSAGVMA